MSKPIVDVISSEYEWICPCCDYLNKEIEWRSEYECDRCSVEVETELPEHATG